MNKDYWRKIFIGWFHIPKKSKIAYYRNPNEFTSFTYEKVNPEHIAVIWGHRKNRNPVRVGKVFSPSIMTLHGGMYDKIVYFLNWLSSDLGFAMCLYYIFIAVLFFAIVYNIPLLENLIYAKRHLIIS